MNLASALNILRPTLPYYLALTKYNLPHLDANTVEFAPHPAALPIALVMPSASPDMPALALTRDEEPNIIAGKPVAEALAAYQGSPCVQWGGKPLLRAFQGISRTLPSYGRTAKISYLAVSWE